jgi:hypothetical protein
VVAAGDDGRGEQRGRRRAVAGVEPVDAMHDGRGAGENDDARRTRRGRCRSRRAVARNARRAWWRRGLRGAR